MAKSNSVRKKQHKQKIGKNTLRRRKLSQELSEFIGNIAGMQKELSKANILSRNFIIGLCSSLYRDLPYYDLIFGQAAEKKTIDDEKTINEVKYQIFAFNAVRNEHILNFNKIIDEVGNPLLELRKLIDDDAKWKALKDNKGKEAVKGELDSIDIQTSVSLVNAQNLLEPTLGFSGTLIEFKDNLVNMLPEDYIDWMETEYRAYCVRLQNGEQGLTKLTDIEKALEEILIKEWSENKELYHDRLEREIEEEKKKATEAEAVENTEEVESEEETSPSTSEEVAPDTSNETGGDDAK